MENRAKYIEIEIHNAIYLIYIDMNLKSFGSNNKIWQIKNIFPGLPHHCQRWFYSLQFINATW